MNRERAISRAAQAARALRLFAGALELDDSAAMEIADVYEPWAADKTYAAGKTLKYGANQWGETQLYRAVQAHRSQAEHPPDAAPALYKPVGFDGGTPLWTQPLGAFDAYEKGDAVSHNGERWTSTADGNVWEPGVYGWVKKA
jgi:hypothetical protein